MPFTISDARSSYAAGRAARDAEEQARVARSADAIINRAMSSIEQVSAKGIKGADIIWNASTDDATRLEVCRRMKSQGFTIMGDHDSFVSVGGW